MTTITVKAAPGLRVPREDNGRKYITDDQETPVEQTAYYLRRLADGDLVEVQPEPAAGQASQPDTPAADASPADTSAADAAASRSTRAAKKKGA